MAVTAKSGATICGRCNRATCSSARLAKVVSSAGSMRAGVMGLDPQPDRVIMTDPASAPEVSFNDRRTALPRSHTLKPTVITRCVLNDRDLVASGRPDRCVTGTDTGPPALLIKPAKRLLKHDGAGSFGHGRLGNDQSVFVHYGSSLGARLVLVGELHSCRC